MTLASTLAPALVVAMVLAPIANARAVDLQILAGGGIAGPMKELAAQFESATGQKLAIRFGTTPDLIKMATTGGPFDAAIVPREVFKDDGAKAKFVAGLPTDIAHVGLGIAVRSGATKPDVRTADALKQALLEAPSIATIPASAGGAQVLRLFERLGIGEAMRAKTKALLGPAELVVAVANGEATLGILLINVLTAPGLDVVGPVPAEINQEIFYIAAVAANARQADAAQAFIEFLRTPAAKVVIKAKGMTPS
jgi:molybdate transport system substrate-binding protein